MTEVDQLLNEVCRHGLGISASGLTKKERALQRETLRTLIRDQEGVPFKVLLIAARYGMRKVWPFTEEHRPYDAVDLQKNIIRAKAAAMMMLNQGIIPQSREEALALQRPQEEDDDS